ncbi:MAG: hypothetical protein V4805_07480 [Pseudomonadota bacterium]
MDTHSIPFSSRTEFQNLALQCLGRAEQGIQLFDPNFLSWNLGSLETNAILRQFLISKQTNRLQLAMHDTLHIERECPRFISLLRDFSHAIECRVTPRTLHQLTDSFCMADGKHIVRRFHCDHFRGAATWDSEPDCNISSQRFSAMWEESTIGLHATTLGL